MLRTNIVVIILLLSIAGRSQSNDSAILDVFDLRPETPDSSRAEAFANWFCNTSIDEEILTSMGIRLEELMQALSIKDEKDAIATIRQEFYFYKEQGIVFKNNVENYLKKVYPECTRRSEEKLEKSTVDVVVYRLAAPNSFLLGVRALPDTKGKINAIITNPNCKPTGSMFFHKKKGKFRKTKIPTQFVFQEYTREDEQTSIKVLIDKEHFTTTLNPIAHPLPYVRRYFSSDYAILESEKIALTWEVLGATEVALDNGIGLKPLKWQLNVSPLDTTDYILSASNEFGQITSSVHIDVVQTVLSTTKLTFFCPEAGDPKLASSKIILKILDMNEEEVARYEGGANLEMNGKTPYYGPFTLTWNNAIYKRQLRRGKIVIELQGNENDVWTFSPILLLNYSDGTKNELFGFGNKVIETGKPGVVIEF